MALLGNYNVLDKTAGTWRSGGATGQGLDRGSFGKTGAVRNRYQRYDPRAAHPLGTMPGNAMVVAQKAGGIGSRYAIAGAGVLTASGAMGINAESAIAAVGALDATGQLVVNAVAAIAGTGALSGNILAALAAAANLAGAGDAVGSLAALGWTLASLSGVASVVVTIEATGELGASIQVGAAEELTAPGIAAEILDSQLVETGLTVRETLRLCVAAMAGRISGAPGTTITIRNAVADDADRIVATVDSNGNRTAISYDLS